MAQIRAVIDTNVLFEGLHYGQISMWCNWQFSSAAQIDQHTLMGASLDTDTLKYAVAKHFFRFIRPGDQRLKVDPADEDQVRVTAWRDPEGEHLSVVVLNMRKTEAHIELRLGEAGQGRSFQHYQTKAGARFQTLAPIEASGPTIRVELPAMSLTTLSDLVTS